MVNEKETGFGSFVNGDYYFPYGRVWREKYGAAGRG